MISRRNIPYGEWDSMEWILVGLSQELLDEILQLSAARFLSCLHELVLTSGKGFGVNVRGGKLDGCSNVLFFDSVNDAINTSLFLSKTERLRDISDNVLDLGGLFSSFGLFAGEAVLLQPSDDVRSANTLRDGKRCFAILVGNGEVNLLLGGCFVHGRSGLAAKAAALFGGTRRLTISVQILYDLKLGRLNRSQKSRVSVRVRRICVCATENKSLHNIERTLSRRNVDQRGAL